MNGQIQGFGKEKYHDGTQYEGNFVAGKKHGKGKYIYADGAEYDGDWVKDKMEGKTGRFTFPDGR